MEPVRLEIFLDDKTLAGIGSVTNNAKAVELVYKLLTERLQTELANVRNEMEKLNTQGIDTTESQKRVAQLENALEDLEKQMKATQAAGATPVVDADVAARQEKSLGKLRMSFAQVARELPALAIGPEMFFLAISNNIPMVQDALHDARKENEALAASGKKGIPIWKQVAQSIVSWQMALAVAVTLLVVYGKEIVEFTKGLFGANEALVDSVRATEEYQAAVSEASGKVVSQLMTMSQEWANLGDNIAAQEQYILDNRDRFDELGLSIRDVSEAERAFVTDTEKVIQAMIARSEAATMTKSIEEEMAEAMELYKKWQQTSETMTYSTYAGLPFLGGKWVEITTRNPEKDEARKEYDDKIREIKELFAFRDEQNKIYADILKQLGIAAADEVPEGTVAYFDKLIEQQRKLLKEAKSRGEYQNIEKEIEQLEAAKERITGKKQQETGNERQQREKDLSETMLRLQRENQQAEIDLMAEGAAKKREQLKLDYLRQLDEIKAQEKAVGEATKGQMSDEQLEGFRRAYGLADETYVQGLKDIDKQEQEDNRKKLEGLLEQYRDYDQKRMELERQYQADLETYNQGLAEAEAKGDTPEVKSIRRSIEARTEAYKDGMRELQTEMLKTSDFYSRLFADYSQKGYGSLREAVERAKSVLGTATTTGDGVTFTLPMLQEDGQIVKQQVNVTVEEFNRLMDRLNEMSRKLERKNPFKSLSDAFRKLKDDLKGGDELDIEDSINEVQHAAKEAIDTLRDWGQDLSKVFGEGFGTAVDEIAQMADGVVDLGTGLGQIYSGDIVGGIGNIFSGIANIYESATAWKEKYEAFQTRIYLGEMRYQELLREQNLELSRQQNIIATILDDSEQLQWLIEHGFTGGESKVTQWEAMNKELNALKENLSSAIEDYDELRNKLNEYDATTGWVSTGSLGQGYQAWWDINENTTAEELAKMYEQGYLQGPAKEYYEQWKETGGEISDIVENIEELKTSMRELIVGTSFDSFLQSSLELIKNDITGLGQFTEETLQNALLNAFMYQKLAGMLEPLYDELADMFVEGTPGKDEIEEWKKRYEEAVKEAYGIVGDISSATGIDLSQGSTQTPDRGAFTALTQEQGTKLEGLFTSVQDHVIGIHQLVKQLEADRDADNKTLARIEENTAYCRYLETIDERLDRMERNGIKVN